MEKYYTDWQHIFKSNSEKWEELLIAMWYEESTKDEYDNQ